MSWLSPQMVAVFEILEMVPMRRREFLKMIGVAAVCPSLPENVAKKPQIDDVNLWARCEVAAVDMKVQPKNPRWNKVARLPLGALICTLWTAESKRYNVVQTGQWIMLPNPLERMRKLEDIIHQRRGRVAAKKREVRNEQRP